MKDELYDSGTALVRLGLQIKRGKDTGLDQETLSKFLELARLIPEARRKSWTPEKDPLGSELLEDIRNGRLVLTGANDPEVSNALSRLRRNGLIVNRGSRRYPKWHLVG